jgi:copper chaperone CopZ
MTCGNCEATVKSRLLALPDITEIRVSKEEQSVTITMDRHVSVSALQEALGGTDAKYRIRADEHSETMEQAKSWLQTYRPVLLIFAYITGITLLIQASQHHFSFMHWMQHFMAGFFLVFSFFKLLNLQGFAESYRMYDVIARRFKAWGYCYAFLELLLGLAYLADFQPVLTNAVTLVVMSVSRGAAKCAQQTQDPVRLFGCRVRSPDEHHYDYRRRADDCHERCYTLNPLNEKRLIPPVPWPFCDCVRPANSALRSLCAGYHR